MLFRSLLLTVAVSVFFATPLMAQQQPGHALSTLAAEEHPFLEWGGEYPRWSRLTPAKGVADIRLAIDRARQKLEAICQVPPQGATWENTFGVYEQLCREIFTADVLLSNLFNLMDSPEVRAAQEEVAPLVAEFDSSIAANARLWSVIRAASTAPWVGSLSPARQRYVQQVLDAFKDSGADLPADKKARKMEIEKELAALYIQFDKNCKDALDSWQLIITDKAKLAGLSEDWMARAASRALFAGGDDDSNMPTTQLDASVLTDGKIGILDLLSACKLIPSKSEGRRLVQQGGVFVDGEKVAAPDATVSEEQLRNGVKIRKGKKVYHKAIIG